MRRIEGEKDRRLEDNPSWIIALRASAKRPWWNVLLISPQYDSAYLPRYHLPELPRLNTRRVPCSTRQGRQDKNWTGHGGAGADYAEKNMITNYPKTHKIMGSASGCSGNVCLVHLCCLPAKFDAGILYFCRCSWLAYALGDFGRSSSGLARTFWLSGSIHRAAVHFTESWFVDCCKDCDFRNSYCFNFCIPD